MVTKVVSSSDILEFHEVKPENNPNEDLQVRWLEMPEMCRRKTPREVSSSTVGPWTSPDYQLFCEQKDGCLQESEWARFSGEPWPPCPSAGLGYKAPTPRKARGTCSHKDPISAPGLCSTIPGTQERALYPPRLIMIPGQNPQRRPGPHPTRGSSSDRKHRWMADQPFPPHARRPRRHPPPVLLEQQYYSFTLAPPPHFLFLICQIQSVLREKCLSLHPCLPTATVLPRDFRPPPYSVRSTSASAQGARSLPHRLSLSNPLLKYSLSLYSCPRISYSYIM